MTNPRIIFPRAPQSYTHFYDYLAFIELRLCRPKVKSRNRHLHHILPRCLGGKDNKSNLVSLTFGEHFMAHYLLCKAFPNERGLHEAIKLFDKSSSWEYQETMEALSKIPISEETREKLKQSTTNLWKDPTYREKVLKNSKGPKHTKESKEKLSQIKTEQWKDPDFRGRMKNVLDALSQPPSLETRKKMSESHKGKKLSDSHIAAASEGRKDKEVWKHYDYLFELWIKLGKCGSYKLWKRSGIGSNRNALKTMIEEFKKKI